MLQKKNSSGLKSKLFATKSKEYSNLGSIIKSREYINFESEKKDLVNLVQDKNNDREIIDLAQKDLDELTKKEKYENDLKVFCYQKMKMITKMQLQRLGRYRGLEASLFCADLFKMYEKVYGKKWKLEIINISKVRQEDLKK